MEQSEELNDSLEHGNNVIASVPRMMTMRDDANAGIIVPFEVESNSQLPATSVCVTSSVAATTTTMVENATAADAVIDLCNTSPTPSTSKTAAAAAAASVINVDSSPEEQSPNDEDVAGPSAVIECPICLQTCIHPARLPCGHIFCFLCVKVSKQIAIFFRKYTNVIVIVANVLVATSIVWQVGYSKCTNA